MTDGAPGGADHELGASLVRALVDNLPEMVAYWDANQRCRFANRAYEMWFGVRPETMIGCELRELLGPLYQLNLPYIEGALRGEEQQFERDIPDPKGGPPRSSLAHYVPDVIGGKVQGFCVLVADITQRKHAEAAKLAHARQNQETARLAGMAALAAGVGHELNNPLAVVMANLESALESVCEGDSTKQALAAAWEAAFRMRDIVLRMTTLAGEATTEAEPVDLGLVVTSSIRQAAIAMSARASVIRNLGDVGWVRSTESLLVQALSNLLVNAAESFPRPDPTRNQIAITTRLEGSFAVVEVADNGCGIAEDVRSRIFDPFFTTKDIGAGQGLGLGVSSAIISRLGGRIDVESTPGEGTTFRVSLPVCPAPADARRRAHAAMRRHLLIVDDEHAITAVLERALGDDYEVTSVNHARDALALLDHGFDLVLCDLMMPEMSGMDLHAAICERKPELADRFVFMTGGAFSERAREFLANAGRRVVQKPFDIDHLMRTLGRVGAS